MVVQYILIALAGYGIGCLNPAYFFSRARGFDIRHTGSNNAGASNATVTMGLSTGVLVALLDILKSYLAAFWAALIFPDLACAALVAGVAAVTGHIFPFYLHFRGGKGFASFLGMTLAIDWRYFLAMIVISLLLTILTDYIAIATITTVLTFPLYLAVLYKEWLPVFIVSIASVIIFIKHKENIQRILHGEEIGLRQALQKKKQP